MPAFGEKLHSLFVELDLDPSGLSNVGPEIDNALAKSGQLKKFGKQATKALTIPIALAGGAAVKAFADFDDAMTQSIAIMDDVGEDDSAPAEIDPRWRGASPTSTR